MRRRAVAVLVIAGGLALGPAAPASAEAKGRIVGVTPGNGELQISFSVAGLEPGQRIDLSSVGLTLAGQPLEVTAEAASAAPAARVARSVILAIDTSGSMAGPGIIGAREAATAYLNTVPADVRVGLVTFADDALLTVPLTTDRGPILAAVAGLQARGDTALYDAVALAARSFPVSGDRQILLLSDGADDGSTTPLPDVTTLLGQGDVALNAVAFRNTEVQSTLEQLTTAAGGRVISTEQTAELSAAFTQAAAASDDGSQVVLTAAIPASFTSREGTVVVTAVAAGQQLSDSALAVGLSQRAVAAPAVVDAGPRPADLGPAFLRSSMTLYLALAAMFLGLLFLVGTAASAIRGHDRVSGRLEIYTLAGRGGREQGSPGEGGKSVARSVMGVADKVVKSRDLEARLGQRLDAGGIPLKPAEWLLLHLGIAFCVPLLVLFLTNANIVLTGLAVFLSAFGPWGYLKLKKRLRTRAFLAQLPDVLQLMSGSLSAGYSLPQAVDAVVRQGNEPVATEFNKALVEARIGAPIEDALDDVGTRMDSVDFGWVVMAIRIQRDVGGNLAEILSTVAATLRERERLRRQVQVLSAEGKLSAYILGGLPIAFALYLLVTNPGYLRPLITDPIGWILLGGMAMLMVVGSLWMKKVVTVEV